MLNLSKESLFSRRSVRLAALVLFLAAQGTVAIRAQAQDAVAPKPAETMSKPAEGAPKPATTTPQAEFQYSALTGSGDTILATRVPAVDSTGLTHYWDVTLLFDVDENGNLMLAAGYPIIVASPNLITAGFQPGNYQGPSNINGGNDLITVSGPGVGPGGTTEWTLAASPGANSCTYPGSATWYVGPLASNPIESRLKKAGITSTAYSYGTGGTSGCDLVDWYPDSILGFSQVGDTITIYSYTYEGSTDYSTPLAQITYTLIQ